MILACAVFILCASVVYAMDLIKDTIEKNIVKSETGVMELAQALTEMTVAAGNPQECQKVLNDKKLVQILQKKPKTNEFYLQLVARAQKTHPGPQTSSDKSVQ